MAGVKLASISESEILRIQDDAVLQKKKRARKFGLNVSKGKRRVHTFANQCLTSNSFFQIIIADNLDATSVNTVMHSRRSIPSIFVKSIKKIVIWFQCCI